MSNIESLTLWNEGVVLMEKKDYPKAITVYSKVPETSSKTLFNTAVCHVILGGHRQALQAAEKALAKDEYLAVGYYLKGIINFQLNRFDEAAKDFEQAHTNLRGRKVIDYNQLGLKYKLFDYEPLYNAGVVWSHLGNRPKALDCLLQAQKSQNDLKRLNIDQVIAAVDKSQKVQLLQVPYAEMIFRPPKTKMANLQKKDYLGKAKVISALDNNDKSPGFEAPRKLSQGLLQVDQLPIKQSSAPSSPTSSRKNQPIVFPSRPSQDSTSNLPDKSSQLEKAIGEAASRLKATGLQLPSRGMKTSKSDSNLAGQDIDNVPSSRKNLPPPPNKPAPKLPGRGASNGNPSLSSASPSPPEKPVPTLLVGGSSPSKPLPVLPSKSGITTPTLPNKPPPSLPGKASLNNNPPPPNKPAPVLQSKQGSSHSMHPPPNKPAPSPSSRQPLTVPPGRTGNESKAGVQKIGTKEFNLNQKRSKPLPQLPDDARRQVEGSNGEESLYLYAEEKNQLTERIEMLKQVEKNRYNPEEKEYTEADYTREQSQNSETPIGRESFEEKIKQRKPLPLPKVEVAPTHIKVINTPATSTPYNKPPKPPYSAKSMVTVEINCNGLKSLKFKKGTSLEKLLSTACEEFVLEHGTVDLWYKRASDDEFICIEDETEMSDLWSGVKDKLTLWCFSKD